ncbi:MAG: pilus assembly protein N-terminal domain-containing protein [Aliidiomarina sp.]|uniref:pilus assembly protein N-terminal domain-containing protein n=1 Tax=Aliidiomarina sp. TaxID=1872439 RepID=UPI0025C31B3E|nr:pilus assembly protein N-terminal domain-containing protein [Aliidiomarina sp.]MCH8502078.1 pilus assembly protein N-terminal domain-containing protein [Aliidiomarina sp.]
MLFWPLIGVCLLPVPSIADTIENETLVMEIGSLEVISSSRTIQRIANARPDIVEARMLDDQNLLLIGLSTGSIDLMWWSEDEQPSRRRIRVYANEDRQLQGRVDAILATPRLEPLSAASEAVELTWRYGDLYLHGAVPSSQFHALLTLQNEYPQLQLHGLQERTETAEIIELEVQVYEISRRWLQQLGLRWQPTAAGPVVGVLADAVGGEFWRVAAAVDLNVVPGDSQLLQELARGNHSYIGWMTSLQSILHLVQERGVGQVLATPRLRVESGTQASFLAGGEIPVPQSNALGQQDVTFKNYGVQLQVAPALVANDQIRTHVISELSHPDMSVAVQGVPGLRSRRTETTVTVNDGETLVIAGLINYEESTVRSGLPGSMSGPNWWQSLWSSQDQSHQQSEVVVVITPRNVSRQQRLHAARGERQQQLLSQFQQLGCAGLRETEVGL